MTNRKQILGQWGEDVAVKYLQAHGYSILARKQDLLLFVEVKTRSSHAFAFPDASVTIRKQMHLLSAAEYYLELEPDRPETRQFDVLAIERGLDGKPAITQFENVIG